ncbi:MAG: sugar ABC transporter substrate-binding protein [Anaerolineales bacterium]|nr:sugar ABC transporter substrate-binding protein [Anaerolineales bacterium]
MKRMHVMLWLLLAALVGCGGNTAAPVVDEAGETAVSAAETVRTDENGAETAVDAGPVTLRLGVALTPQELESFQAALAAVQAGHPEWTIELELTPQQSLVEKITTQVSAGELPDVFRVQGLTVQQWIRQGAFLELTPLIEASGLDLGAFFPGPLAQFEWNGGLYGLPDTAAPDVVFYNKAMFDAAGLDYPTDEWTYDDMRAAALQLTLDDSGRNASDPDFDPEAIVQWGWNGGLTFFWQRHLVRGFGGDFCGNDDCTLMRFTDPETVAAVQWWADLTNQDHATLYDPYGGSQTGVPGDPFIAGQAAMGYNGFFAVGQLNAAGNIDYDIIPPLVGRDGQRYTPLSTNGYVIAADSAHPEAAWALVQALTAAEFLAETWGQPGHSVPARRAAADAILNPAQPPANQAAILTAMEVGEVFRPYTAGAFAAYGQTADLFVQMMRGDLPVAEGLAQIEAAANAALAEDRDG